MECAKSFSVSNRPKVLIFGNGLVRNKSNKSWDEVIEGLSSISRQNIKLPESVPYSLKATLLTDEEDIIRREKYTELFGTNNYKYENNHGRRIKLRLRLQ